MPRNHARDLVKMQILFEQTWIGSRHSACLMNSGDVDATGPGTTESEGSTLSKAVFIKVCSDDHLHQNHRVGWLGRKGTFLIADFPPPRHTVSKTLKVESQESTSQTKVSLIPIQTKNNGLGVGDGGDEVGWRKGRERRTLTGIKGLIFSGHSGINIFRYWLTRVPAYFLSFILLPTLCWLLMTSERLTRILKEGVKFPIPIFFCISKILVSKKGNYRPYLNLFP